MSRRAKRASGYLRLLGRRGRWLLAALAVQSARLTVVVALVASRRGRTLAVALRRELPVAFGHACAIARHARLRLVRALPLLIRTTLAAAAVGGALLLIAADLSTLRDVSGLWSVSGGGQHMYALLVLGLVTLPVGLAAAVLRSPRAMGSLVAAGAVAGIVAVAIDLPSLGSTEPIAQYYSAAKASAGAAIYLEVVGAALLIASGVLQLGLLMRKSPSRIAPRADMTAHQA